MTDLATRRELRAEAAIDREHNAHMQQLALAVGLATMIRGVNPNDFATKAEYKAHLVAGIERCQTHAANVPTIGRVA